MIARNVDMALASQRICNNCGTVNPFDAVSCCRCASSFKITTPLAPEPAGNTANASAAHLKAGDLLENRYCIVSQVGVGGFGAVYKAEDIHDHNRPVAGEGICPGGPKQQQVDGGTRAVVRG